MFHFKFIFITRSHSSSSLPAATKEKAKAVKIKKKWIQKQKLQSWWSPDCCCSNSHDPTQQLGQETKANFNFLLGHRGFEASRVHGCGLCRLSSPTEIKDLESAASQTELLSLHWTLRWCLVRLCFSAGDASRTPSCLGAVAYLFEIFNTDSLWSN